MDTELLLGSALLLLFFVLLTLGELAFVHYLGYDIIAHLEVKKSQGKTVSFVLEAFGVVAFILFQPVLFSWLFIDIVEQLVQPD